MAGIVGHHASAVAGCPDVEWRLARHPDGQITGIFWYSDLSGTSQAVGQIDASGRFHTTLTSAMGQGPVGKLDGMRSSNGKIVADLVGQGCANYHLEMNPVADLYKYHPEAGGD
jgi:hypothetical protein